MRTKIGLLIFSLGVTMGDSECLAIPIIIIGIGILLLRAGKKKGEWDEQG